MKKNKIISILLVIFVVLAIIGIVWYKMENRQVYVPDIPNSHNLSSISYELPSGLITVAEEDKMDKILNGLYDLELSTQEESVQGVPMGVEDLVAIRLYYKEDDAVGNFYIYKVKDKYYLEEPYNGVYKISEKDYNYIIDLIKE